MTTPTSVQRLYHLGHATWYNPFRKIWTKLVERKLEKDFLQVMEKNVHPSTRILELGCGTGINIGRVLALQKPFHLYYGIDFSEDMLAIAKQKYRDRKNVHFLSGNLETISTPQRYDFVLCTWVLSHLKKPSFVINRFYKNLAKDGTMLLIFMTKPKWYLSFWFTPLSYLFAARYVSPQEIAQMHGEKIMKKYASGLATFLIIKKRENE